MIRIHPREDVLVIDPVEPTAEADDAERCWREQLERWGFADVRFRGVSEADRTVDRLAERVETEVVIESQIFSARAPRVSCTPRSEKLTSSLL